MGFQHADDGVFEGVELAWPLNGFSLAEAVFLQATWRRCADRVQFPGDLAGLEASSAHGSS